MALSRRTRWGLAAIPFSIGALLRAYVLSQLGSADGAWSTELIMIAIGMAPYILLCTLISTTFSLAGTLLASIVVVWSDASAVHEGVHGSTSTSVIALVIQPIFAVLVALPLVLALDWLIFLRRRT